MKRCYYTLSTGANEWYHHLMSNRNVWLYAVIGLALFAVSAFGTYFFSSKLKPSPVSPASQTASGTTANKKPKVDPSLPKTEVCPLNGAYFTKPERDVWVTRRPLAVMIENSVDARPQSGLSAADVIYEAVAEGGITRFMGLFYCEAALDGNLTLAPVRSARIYFVNLVSEYDALYTHVGGAGNCDDPNVDPQAKALCAIQKYNIKDLDEMGRAGDYKTCHRLTNRLDHDVAYEHTMACFLDELYNVGAKWNWTNVDQQGVAWNANFVPWKFATTSDPKATGSSASTVSYQFWSTDPQFNKDYDVTWNYDSSTNTYLRSNGGQQSIDLNTGDPLRFKDVVVEFAKQTLLSDLEHHVLYDVIGQGKALVFKDGVAISATWSKLSRTSRTLYKDQSGKDIKFNPGPIWITILPDTNQVQYN